MKGATDYLRYGELINKPLISSPGGVPRMLETGGMYGGESLHSPQGDYGTNSEDYYSQKGPLYDSEGGGEKIQKYEPLPLPPSDFSQTSDSKDSWWTPKRIIGAILMIISVATIYRHPESLKLSKMMGEFQLYLIGFFVGFFLFAIN